METRELLIVFVKNIKLGKVKTRLALTIGDEGAFEIYKKLVEITERETEKLTRCEIHIYYSDVIINTKWPSHIKCVQVEGNLGAKMQDAFERGFEMGYESIIGIGSDLPSLTVDLIERGFDQLDKNSCVFGPAKDGGYYLIGMNQLYPMIFENKSWSTSELLKETLNELNDHDIKFTLLEELNDIDTFEDLIESGLTVQYQPKN